MPRGYRCIVFAIVGWLALCGAKPPEQRTPSATPERQQSPTPNASPTATAETYRPYPRVKDPDCYKDENHDSADLCAQWRAALAAEKAAQDAFVGNIVAGVGAALSIISTFLVIIALGQTRKANRIAHSSARPHVIVSLENFSRFVWHNDAQVKFDISATNVGGTGCVVTGVFHAWGTEDDRPEIVTGMHFVVPVAPGMTKSVDPIQTLRKSVLERPIIRGFVTIEGPFILEEEKMIRFAFKVLPDPSYPHLVNYNAFADDHWTKIDERRHRAERRRRYQFWKKA